MAIVQRMQRDFPERDIVLVGRRSLPGANRKVANLRQMMRHAKHDVLVLSDADIRVRPDYLRTIVAPLAEPDGRAHDLPLPRPSAASACRR